MSLSQIINEPITTLLTEIGAFFAFSKSQLEKSSVDGVEYVNLGQGLICPKGRAEELVEGISKITADGIKKDIETNGKEKIIIRELYNYECFYTGDYSNCIDTLEDYGITPIEIEAAYRKELPNSDC